MRFLVGRANSKYTVMPTPHPVDQNGNLLRNVSGYRVRSDRQGIIDTDIHQNAQGWTDDIREMVERHLLGHRDFGMRRSVDSGIQRGDELVNKVVPLLWFAPGQGIPDEHREYIESRQWYKAWSEADLSVLEAVGSQPEATKATNERPCLGRLTSGNTVTACRNPAVDGEDYCEVHAMAEAAV